MKAQQVYMSPSSQFTAENKVATPPQRRYLERRPTRRASRESRSVSSSSSASSLSTLSSDDSWSMWRKQRSFRKRSRSFPSNTQETIVPGMVLALPCQITSQDSFSATNMPPLSQQLEHRQDNSYDGDDDDTFSVSSLSMSSNDDDDLSACNDNDDNNSFIQTFIPYPSLTTAPSPNNAAPNSRVA